jgi:hypothetical protein
MASQRVEVNTVLCLDLSGIRKEYAKKMEYSVPVHDGSTGEIHAGLLVVRYHGSTSECD